MSTSFFQRKQLKKWHRFRSTSDIVTLCAQQNEMASEKVRQTAEKWLALNRKNHESNDWARAVCASYLQVLQAEVNQVVIQPYPCRTIRRVQLSSYCAGARVTAAYAGMLTWIEPCKVALAQGHCIRIVRRVLHVLLQRRPGAEITSAAKKAYDDRASEGSCLVSGRSEDADEEADRAR